MNFLVIISYLKVKNLSRKSGFEKCKKGSKNHPSKVSPGRQKQQKQSLSKNNKPLSKIHHNGKKLAARLVEMAQNGQYNYMRCHAHKEDGAAGIMLAGFVTSCIQTVFLLNAEYCPYAKWMFRAMRNLPLLTELADPLEFLLNDPAPHKEKAALIEDICTQIVKELIRRDLSDARGNYLENHAFEVMKKIRNPQIRSLHVMEG